MTRSWSFLALSQLVEFLSKLRLRKVPIFIGVGGFFLHKFRKVSSMEQVLVLSQAVLLNSLEKKNKVVT